MAVAVSVTLPQLSGTPGCKVSTADEFIAAIGPWAEAPAAFRSTAPTLFVFGFLLYLLAIMGFVAVTLLMNRFVGPKSVSSEAKLEPFECGATPVDTHNVKAVPIKYYAVAIIFILFDLETVFLFLWALGAQPLTGELLAAHIQLINRHHLEHDNCNWASSASTRALSARACTGGASRQRPGPLRSNSKNLVPFPTSSSGVNAILSSP